MRRAYTQLGLSSRVVRRRPRSWWTAITVAMCVVATAAAAYGAVDAGGADAGAQADAAPGPAVTAPVPLGPIQPAYPDTAMKAGIEGNVTLILDIDATGAVTKVEVESGLPGGLTEAAVAAASAARFKPATDAAGRPTPVRIRWLLQFTLPEKR